MSPSSERRDEGFSLVEIIVALGVLMVVMVALLPQLVVGIKATGTARLATQAKGVAQGQLEKMRNLPYYISPDAGDYRDVLDTYYRNLSTPAAVPQCLTSGTYTVPQSSWTGYVSTSAARCDYEPSGAFYRKVSTVADATGGDVFTVVVSTQFLSGLTPPAAVAPVSTYDSQSKTGSRPASSQIGTVVSVLYGEQDEVQAVSTYTQLANRPAATVRVRAESNVAALEVGSEMTSADSASLLRGPLALSAGLVDLAGSLTYASTVNANLAATSASLATGVQEGGAAVSLAAPPTTSASFTSDGQDSLTIDGCAVACWGNTRVDAAPASAADGLPTAGSPSAPMQALVTDKGGHAGISFGNSVVAADYRPELKLQTPLVLLHPDATAHGTGIAAGCTASSTGTPSYVTAAGYVQTTSVDDTGTVDACAVSKTSRISLFPTTFAPQGVVVVELTRASARCTVSGSTHTAAVAHDYSALVSYWDGTAYVTLPPIVPGAAADPLDSVDPLTTSVGGGKVLGDYIASWSSLLDGEVTATAADGVARVTLPGVVTIGSQPTRPDTSAAGGLDPTSVVSVTVGALGCLAEDAR